MAVEGLGWLALAPMVLLCLTQWFGISPSRPVVVLQALSLFVLAPSVIVALVAALNGRHAMAQVAVLPLATQLGLTAPVVFHTDPPAAAADAPRLTVGYANFLASNPTADSGVAALAATDADVLVLVEFTPRLRDLLDAAVGSGEYPHRLEDLQADPSGIGLWSRRPIVSGGVTVIGSRVSVDVVVDVDGAHVRVLALHPFPPTFDTGGWVRELEAIAERTAGSPLPTLLVGDFNGARWHPAFRDLLDAGWTDTHEALGHGFSVSWPLDNGWLPPQFIRLDHALYGGGVVPVRVRDVVIPGSDHKGFVAEYALPG